MLIISGRNLYSLELVWGLISEAVVWVVAGGPRGHNSSERAKAAAPMKRQGRVDDVANTAQLVRRG